MALKKCKECGKEVSTSAKTCPHCGVKDPGVGAKEKLGGCLILIILVALAAIYFSRIDETNNTETVSATKTCTSTDTQCLFDQNWPKAAMQCKTPIQKLAKYDYEWTDGILTPMFSHSRLDAKNNQMTFIGDKVKFTNGFNAKVPMIYDCTMDLSSKAILDVRVEQGRL
ncbi:zinc-ribbon domain-containing protein [Xenorhabdus sp. XENO-10]|uniref:Zinc-ribbon domain-containing protein n=1 Tax=Xenorhabdus yunnanensis TaxID=3025878 RepID=A0ABT5LJT8_9GAMM|nr:zinc-ribbon domain-containing protein [Xenorhabdus yunnanensis]MDC9590716.1 zinc-ribbon domain-containing protein [Xenorhabdus yunnanensis]